LTKLIRLVDVGEVVPEMDEFERLDFLAVFQETALANDFERLRGIELLALDVESMTESLPEGDGVVFRIRVRWLLSRVRASFILSSEEMPDE
jgi:hypothetical protein